MLFCISFVEALLVFLIGNKNWCGHFMPYFKLSVACFVFMKFCSRQGDNYVYITNIIILPILRSKGKFTVIAKGKFNMN